MKDSLIILDFDHTVFNTTQYVEALKKHFADNFGISETEFDEKRNAVKDCCVVVDIDSFVASLSPDDNDVLHDSHHEFIEARAHEFVFSDVRDFMTTQIHDHDILILTHGDQELQTQKIKHSKLPEGYEVLISLQQKDKALTPYIEKYSSVAFFDDKPKNIALVKQAFPKVQSYFVAREDDKPYADQPMECDCADHTVSLLALE